MALPRGDGTARPVVGTAVGGVPELLEGRRRSVLQATRRRWPRRCRPTPPTWSVARRRCCGRSLVLQFSEKSMRRATSIHRQVRSRGVTGGRTATGETDTHEGAARHRGWPARRAPSGSCWPGPAPARPARLHHRRWRNAVTRTWWPASTRRGRWACRAPSPINTRGARTSSPPAMLRRHVIDYDPVHIHGYKALGLRFAGAAAGAGRSWRRTTGDGASTSGSGSMSPARCGSTAC